MFLEGIIMSLNNELKELVHSTYEKATHIIQEVKNTFEHEKYSNTVTASNDEMTNKTSHQIEAQKEIHNIVDITPTYSFQNKSLDNVSESLINTSKLDKVDSENKMALSKLDM